jgi:hypothetical protein
MRAAAAAAIALVIGILLTIGISGAFGTFSAETQNPNSAYAGGWVVAPTGLGTPTYTTGTYGASLAWTHQTTGVTGQELWYTAGTSSTCPGAPYTSLLTGATLSAVANAVNSPGPPDDAVPSGDNGDYICYEIRSTHNAWYTGADFTSVQVGLVPTSVTYSGTPLQTNSTITIHYNQNIGSSVPAHIEVCISSGSVVFGSAASCTASVGTLTGGTSTKTFTCTTSTATVTSSTTLVIKLAGCPGGAGGKAAMGGTANYFATGATVASSSGAIPQCTVASCNPQLAY